MHSYLSEYIFFPLSYTTIFCKPERINCQEVQYAWVLRKKTEPDHVTLQGAVPLHAGIAPLFVVGAILDTLNSANSPHTAGVNAAWSVIMQTFFKVRALFFTYGTASMCRRWVNEVRSTARVLNKIGTGLVAPSPHAWHGSLLVPVIVTCVTPLRKAVVVATRCVSNKNGGESICVYIYIFPVRHKERIRNCPKNGVIPAVCVYIHTSSSFTYCEQCQARRPCDKRTAR